MSTLGSLLGHRQRTEYKPYWKISWIITSRPELVIAEQINVYKGLVKFFTLHKKDMKQTGLLTVQLIYEVHGELMSGLHKDAGDIRTGAAFVPWKNEDYFYPEPRVAKQLFYACVDHHTVHMNTYAEKFAKHPPSVESVGYLFKCVARLMFDFVDAHPFGDGNGRMCRLLANYVLSMITPFPVAPYSGEQRRKNTTLMLLLNAEITRLKVLGHWLLCCAWRGWKSLFDSS